MPEDELDRFDAAHGAVESLMGSKGARFEEAKAATSGESSVISEAKEGILTLRTVIPMALRRADRKDVDPESFNGGELRRSTPKILAYLTRIIPLVEKLDDVLAKHFRGQVPSKMSTDLRDRLHAANAAQADGHNDLTEAGAANLEAKGRLLQFIEDVNRFGKVAYQSDPVVRASFTKDECQATAISDPFATLI